MGREKNEKDSKWDWQRGERMHDLDWLEMNKNGNGF